jgi:hypothetical protein
VLHISLAEGYLGRLMWPCGPSVISCRRFTTSLKTCSAASVSYLVCLVRSIRSGRGLAKIWLPSLSYSCMQSMTVIRNLPSIIARRLLIGEQPRLRLEGCKPWKHTLRRWSHQCSQNSGRGDIFGPDLILLFCPCLGRCAAFSSQILHAVLATRLLGKARARSYAKLCQRHLPFRRMKQGPSTGASKAATNSP